MCSFLLLAIAISPTPTKAFKPIGSTEKSRAMAPRSIGLDGKQLCSLILSILMLETMK